MDKDINGRFQNLDETKAPLGFFDVLKWRLTSRKPKWPKNVELKKQTVPKTRSDELVITYIGHTTFLIQLHNLNIITDPIYSNRASPFSFIGPKRVVPPGVSFANLPKIDIILISHNHYDHLDIPTVKALHERDRPKVYCGLGDDLILKGHIKDIDVNPCQWHQRECYDEDIDISFEPTQHWSARGLFDKNKSLWGAFVIISKRDGAVCFIGDSGYSKAIFEYIGNEYNISIAITPIGAYKPQWFMRDVHMSPDESVKVHKDLKAKISIASHFDTFPLADDEFNEAPKALAIALAKNDLSNSDFITPVAGRSYKFDLR